jgi:hypothetical protein
MISNLSKWMLMQHQTEFLKLESPNEFIGFFHNKLNHCSECKCKIEDKDDGIVVFDALHCFFCAQVK